jgi:hypothetical protein
MPDVRECNIICERAIIEYKYSEPYFHFANTEIRSWSKVADDRCRTSSSFRDTLNVNIGGWSIWKRALDADRN